jgi:hypothetical protein
MTSRKRGLPSLARLLQLSEKAAAQYADGDLSRIEVDEDPDEGVYVVIVLPESRPAKRVAPTPTPTPEPTRRDGFTVIELPPALPPRQRITRRKKKEAPAPREVAPPPASGPLRKIADALPDFRTEADWASVDLPGTAYALSLAVGKGLPTDLQVDFHPDVLALAGVDLDAAESCIRRPERVEIAEETAKKGYPIIRFHRGDVCSVLGFREPRRPMAIAVYFSSAALKEYQGRGGSGSGSGGARKESGIPRTGTTLMKRIREMGATVTVNGDEKTAFVEYKGQALGQVVIASTARRPEIEQAWQRTQRRITAIKNRGETKSVHV